MDVITTLSVAPCTHTPLLPCIHTTASARSNSKTIFDGGFNFLGPIPH